MLTSDRLAELEAERTSTAYLRHKQAASDPVTAFIAAQLHQQEQQLLDAAKGKLSMRTVFDAGRYAAGHRDDVAAAAHKTLKQAAKLNQGGNK